jgi:hypothetical protein
MRDRLKQLTAVTVLVLVAGGSLVACGDKDDAKADGVGESAGGSLTKTNFFDKISKAQKKAGTSHVVMSVKVAGQAIKADGDLNIGGSAADTAMAMTMQSGQAGLGSIEMRLIDQVFYLNFGPMTSNKFAKVDLTDTSNPIGKQYSEIVGSLDPSQQLKEFEGAVSSFDQKGKAITLDGVKAQPYVIGIDTSKMASAEKASGSMPKKFKYTMYVGPDNLPRRVLTELPSIAGAGGSTMSINYSKWGEKVTIAKPKASEITDKDFFSQLSGGTPTPS